MKTCPVCKSACFDDMEVCYGCLHRFSQKTAEDPWEELEQESSLAQNDSEPDRVQIPLLFSDQKLRGFKIMIEPVY